MLLDVVLAKPARPAFPSVGEVTSVLEIEGQCPGAKVGLSRIEVSAGTSMFYSGHLKASFSELGEGMGWQRGYGFGLSGTQLA